MAAASPAPAPSAPAGADSATGFGRTLDRILDLATSTLGKLTGCVVAITAAVIAIQRFGSSLQGLSRWMLFSVLSAVVFLLVIYAASELVEQSREKWLVKVPPNLQPGYFQLAPREDEKNFPVRSDDKHEEILQWLQQRTSPILYLTGLSGSGKSSLLAAWVLPRLEDKVVRLRSYQDPIALLEQKLLTPGVIWKNPPAESGGIQSLLERACRYLRPKRLLVVLDQFEEFVILQDPNTQQRFQQLMSGLCEQPIDGLTFLLAFRNEYTSLIEKMSLPQLHKNVNWKEVRPFEEAAAQQFIHASGLQISDDLLRDVLREAAETEGTKGIIRPVTINLCGLVLKRFATGLPREFRGGLIRGFVRESILGHEVGDIAPLLVPHLITEQLTKRPRSVADLAHDTGTEPDVVRGCLRVLGDANRGIVRSLDKNEQTWEISHDFLVPLLDSVVGRWRMPFRRRLRSWLPWIAATAMVAAVVVAANWRRDPILELEDLGWKVHKTDRALELEYDGVPPRQTLKVLRRTSQPLRVRLTNVDNLTSISGWSVLKNLTTLDLSESGFPLDQNLSDLSPLRELTSLSTLDLSGTPVSNVSALQGLKNLTDLDLSRTPVSDVSPLKELTNLTTLNLSLTRVTDLSPLQELKKLTTLHLDSSQVSDASSLRMGIKNLHIIIEADAGGF